MLLLASSSGPSQTISRPGATSSLLPLRSVLSADGVQSIPILALVDGDAYGIDILSVYKYGSMRMKHENEHLAAARVQWLGLWGRELASYVSVVTLILLDPRSPTNGSPLPQARHREGSPPTDHEARRKEGKSQPHLDRFSSLSAPILIMP